MPAPTFRSDMVRRRFSSTISAVAPPPGTFVQWSSCHPIFSGGSWSREFTSTGRSPISRVCSAIAAERFAERTAEYVAAASTSVPPAVASDEIVAQSAIADEVTPTASASVSP